MNINLDPKEQTAEGQEVKEETTEQTTEQATEETGEAVAVE
jgi:hypothetical protein